MLSQPGNKADSSSGSGSSTSTKSNINSGSSSTSVTNGSTADAQLPVPCRTLCSGRQMPLVGLGCWQANGDSGEARAAVAAALRTGYRLIDTAYVYDNELAVGEAVTQELAAGHLQRSQLFVVTKLPFTGMHADRVEKYLRESLRRLQLDFVDLFLIHTPVGCHEPDEMSTGASSDNGADTNGAGNSDANKKEQEVQQQKYQVLNSGGRLPIDPNTDHAAIWRAMEHMVDLGLARDIGVSNFSVRQTQRLLDTAKRQPAVLQVELHVHFQQQSLQEFCRLNDIVLMSYSSLGSPGRQAWQEKLALADQQSLPKSEHRSQEDNGSQQSVLPVANDSNSSKDSNNTPPGNHKSANRAGNSKDPLPTPLKDPVVALIANKHRRSMAQVLLKFLVQQDIVVIPKSVRVERIQENCRLFDFQLDQLDMAALKSLDRGSGGRSFHFAQMFPGYGDHPEGQMD